MKKKIKTKIRTKKYLSISSKYSKKVYLRKKLKKTKENNQVCYAHIKVTKHNVFITILNELNKVLFWTCGGQSKLGGAAKKTYSSLNIILNNIKPKFNLLGIHKLHVVIKGIHSHGHIILAMLKHLKIRVLSYTDITPISYNGCKLPKKRIL